MGWIPRCLGASVGLQDGDRTPETRVPRIARRGLLAYVKAEGGTFDKKLTLEYTAAQD